MNNLFGFIGQSSNQNASARLLDQFFSYINYCQFWATNEKSLIYCAKESRSSNDIVGNNRYADLINQPVNLFVVSYDDYQNNELAMTDDGYISVNMVPQGIDVDKELPFDLKKDGYDIRSVNDILLSLICRGQRYSLDSVKHILGDASVGYDENAIKDKLIKKVKLKKEIPKWLLLVPGIIDALCLGSNQKSTMLTTEKMIDGATALHLFNGEKGNIKYFDGRGTSGQVFFATDANLLQNLIIRSTLASGKSKSLKMPALPDNELLSMSESGNGFAFKKLLLSFGTKVYNKEEQSAKVLKAALLPKTEKPPLEIISF